MCVNHICVLTLNFVMAETGVAKGGARGGSPFCLHPFVLRLMWVDPCSPGFHRRFTRDRIHPSHPFCSGKLAYKAFSELQ